MSQPFSARGLLLPLVPAFRLALALRALRLRSGIEPVRRLRFPVVSIGSLSAGGAGKTPLTIALARALQPRGFRVDVLSRGYGRRDKRPARVDPDGTAEEFGDEPLLIAREASVPVYVAGQRYEAGLLAEAEARASGVHLLDDGFQHRQLARDIDILLMNRGDWRDGLLPAGNLRESRSAIRRATIVAIPADEPELQTELKAWGWEGPIWRLRRTMEIPEVDGPVLAFCGIARPGQFFAGLEAAGLGIAARLAFPDHHRYTSAELKRVVSEARKTGVSALITTEKDRVRLGNGASVLQKAMPLETAHLRVGIENEDEAMEWLLGRLRQRQEIQ